MQKITGTKITVLKLLVHIVSKKGFHKLLLGKNVSDGFFKNNIVLRKRQ
jgi:hypothetical protein